MCGVQLKYSKSVKGLMLLMGLNEAPDQLVMANCVPLCGNMLKREDGYVLRRVTD